MSARDAMLIDLERDRLMPGEQGRAAASSDLGRKVDFLRQPQTYPEATNSVEAVETHMSWVFLTDTNAYKLKKPVRYDYLDFSTPALRRHYCEEELRLNHRLAAQTYLDVIPLTEKSSGELGLGGPYPPVDWLVKMRRLPRERMLDSALGTKTVAEGEITQVALLLAGFYSRTPKIEMRAADYRQRFETQITDNRREIVRYGSGISPVDLDRVIAAQHAFLCERYAQLDQRIAERRIVEAHGDLRPEHVYLGSPPQIIDCLEFRRDFRLLDPVDELASLAMECERLGDPTVGRCLLETYRRVTGDHPPSELIGFYKSVRATVRAKLAIWHLREPDVANPQKWRDQAKRYLELAEIRPVPA